MAWVSTASAEEPVAATPTIDEAEAALVREAVDGNPRAFETLVRQHSQRVFNFIYQMTRQRQDAEDLAQQTFVKAYKHLHRFDPQRPLINWLLTIARRTALNHFRSAKQWEEISESSAAGGLSPARQVEVQDQTNNLWERARRVLGPREFEVLWLRFAEELSTEETARITGLTVANVKVMVFRARQQLMKGEDRS